MLLGLLAGAALAAQTPSAATPWEEAGPLQPIVTADGHTDPAVRGAWRSRGYGWIVDIDEDGVTRFQSGDTCYRPPQEGGPLSDMSSVHYRYFRALPGGKSAIFQLLAGDTNVVFDRLEALPAPCLSPVQATPQVVADAFLDHFERHYAFFDRRPPGFAARAAKLRAKIHPDMDDGALRTALGAFMDGLSDSHTKLIGVVEGKKRRIQDGQGQTLPRIRAGMGEGAWLTQLMAKTRAGLGDTAHQVAQDRIIWGVIDGRVGYLQVFVMGGFTDREDFASPEWAAAELGALDSVLDEAFTAFEGLDAVIVDLSNNRGGWDAVAKALPGRFTEKSYIGFTTRAPRSGLAPFPHWIRPADGPRFDGPVYLMTSDVTVSGGELATLAFRQLPQVRQVGTTTRGSFSTPLPKPLPNDWLLELSNEVFAAPDGTVFEETGIAPQEWLEIYDPADPVASHWKAVQSVAKEAPGD